MATNILADRLKKLKSADIINAKPGQDKKSKIEYGLTHKGMNLLPVMLEIIAWGAKYDDDTITSKEFVHRIKTDRTALMLEILQKLNSK